MRLENATFRRMLIAVTLAAGCSLPTDPGETTHEVSVCHTLGGDIVCVTTTLTGDQLKEIPRCTDPITLTPCWR